MKKAAATRLEILQKAFGLIYTKGYQTTSLDDILATTHVTKGAFYYHFSNKDEMGLAMIREVMFPGMEATLIIPLKNAENPLGELYEMIEGLLLENPSLLSKYGCPAGNLTQEMAPLNGEFEQELAKMATLWQLAIEESIHNGIKLRKIRSDVNARQVAIFIMSGYWGIRNLGKLQHLKDAYIVYLQELKNYLNSMK